MVPRTLVAVSALAFATLFASPAMAWQEAHQIGDDVAVRIDPSGVADVEHHVRWHIVRGPLKSIDLLSVDPGAEVEPAVVITGDDGKSLTGHAAHHDDQGVRVTIDEPRAMMRGNYTFSVRWRLDLVAAHAFARDGATWRLNWSAPVATDGFDSAKTVLTFPAAPDAPVAIVADTGAIDDAAVSSLRRDPGSDVLELVRPHVARGEAPVWTLRIDPRALPLVTDPSLRRPSEAKPPPEPDRVKAVSTFAALAAVAVFFALLVLARARAFAAACEAKGCKPRAIVPMADGVRAALAGVALAAGVGLEVRGQLTAGAACVAFATIAAALRAPVGKLAARGPGKWLVVTPSDAFTNGGASALTAWLTALLALVCVAGAAFVASKFAVEGPWLVALDAIALVPLFATGRSVQLPPEPAQGAAPWLARVFKKLARVSTLRVSPWARFPTDATRPDELRLLVLPRAAMPGVVGVEVGLAWSATPAGWTATPEVLARFLDGTAAASRIARDLPRVRPVPGRRAEERVARLHPASPSGASTLALVRALADGLTDRRLEVKAWKGNDRRTLAAAKVGPSAVASAVACSL